MTRNDGRVRIWRTGRAYAIGVSCLAALLVPASAAGGDEAGARVLFTEGRKLVAAGDYAQACPKFEDSFRLDPGIGTNFNLADCFEHTGRPASAWSRFLDVAAATKVLGQVERERVARARAATLEPRLARLVVEVSAAVPGLVVERDGIAIGNASLGISVPVDPGEHRIDATAPGKKTWSTTVTVPDEPTIVPVSVPVLEALPPEMPAPAAAPPTSAPGASLVATPGEAPRRVPTSAIVLGAVGAAALATSVVFAFGFQSANAEAKALCPGSSCRSFDEKARHDALVADARRDQVLGFISAGIGGAALLTAAYLWWRGPRSASATAGKLSVGSLTGSLDGSVAARLEVAW